MESEGILSPLMVKPSLGVDQRLIDLVDQGGDVRDLLTRLDELIGGRLASGMSVRVVLDDPHVSADCPPPTKSTPTFGRVATDMNEMFSGTANPDAPIWDE